MSVEDKGINEDANVVADAQQEEHASRAVVKEDAQACNDKQSNGQANKVDVGSSSASNKVESSDPVSSPEKVAWAATIILSMLAAFGPICTDIYLPAVPEITADLMTNASAMQLTLTASFLGLALGQLFIGPLSDAYGRKKLLYGSLVVFIISSFWCAFAPDITQLVTARLFQGLAGAGGIVLSRSIACDFYSGAQLTKFISLLMTIHALAPILGPIVGASIVWLLPWEALFIFLALVGIVLLVYSVLKLPESLPKEKRMPRVMATVKDMIDQLTNKRFMLLSLALSFIMGSFFGYLAASPFIFQSIFGMSPMGYSMVFGVIALAISVAANLAGFLSRKLSGHSIVFGSLVIQSLATLSLTALLVFDMADMYNVAICFCIFIAMMGSSQSAGFGMVMAARTGGAGSASGIYGVLTFLFGALTSPLVGLMGEQSMIPMILVMYVCTIAAFYCLRAGSQSVAAGDDIHELKMGESKEESADKS